MTNDKMRMQEINRPRYYFMESFLQFWQHHDL